MIFERYHVVGIWRFGSPNRESTTLRRVQRRYGRTAEMIPRKMSVRCDERDQRKNCGQSRSWAFCELTGLPDTSRHQTVSVGAGFVWMDHSK
jgi:hypothetical protein